MFYCVASLLCKYAHFNLVMLPGLKCVIDLERCAHDKQLELSTVIIIVSATGMALYKATYRTKHVSSVVTLVSFLVDLRSRGWIINKSVPCSGGSISRSLRKFRKATLSFVISVCPHETTRLPLDGF